MFVFGQSGRPAFFRPSNLCTLPHNKYLTTFLKSLLLAFSSSSLAPAGGIPLISGHRIWNHFGDGFLSSSAVLEKA